jgi:tetratricopeptide (TPR) repeat protein
VAALLCVATAVPAMAQRPAPASADSTVPLFVVTAAVNAAGYDADLNSPRNSPVRTQLRQDIEKAAPPCLRDLRVFYAAHRNPNPVRDLSQFISFALLIGGPPDFAFRVREDELPAEGTALRDLRPLLATLYKEARLDELWEKYRPAYERELSRYDDGLARIMLEVNGYLRITTSGFLGRSFSIYVDLLGAPGQVNARSFGPDYYVVCGSSTQPQVDEVRHGYLHYVLDPMAVKDSTLVRSKATLGEFAETAHALDPVLRRNFRLLLTESLIRAAELRMSPLSPVARQHKLQDILSEGLILTPYFYEALEQFEMQDAGMRIYYPEMIDKMDVRREEKRLENVTFRAPSPAGGGAAHLTAMEAAPAQAPRPAAETGQPSGQAAPAAGSEEEKLLAKAEDALARLDFAAARQSFQEALEKQGPLRDYAVYGLALVASQEKQPELAKNYFQQALDLSKSPRLLAWSHIYLGRILDMEQNRDLALQHYRQALVTAEEPAARQAAERGLQAPFRRETK